MGADVPLTWLGGILDRAALRGMQLALTSALDPTSLRRDELRRSAQPYLTAELRTEPRRFFAFLAEPAAPDAMTWHVRRRLPGGIAVARRFATRYVPYHAAGAWRSCAENDVVCVEHWMHRPRMPRATVIALHGFTMGKPWVDAYALMAAQWFSLGVDVALVTLPFHGARAPRTSRYSGELFGSWDVGCLNESVRQALHDVHVVKGWLAARTGAPVGILGLSLGGYVAALAAGLMPDLAFVVPFVAPVCLGALPARLLALAGHEPTAAPFSLEELRAAFRVHCPLTHPLAVPGQRVLIIAGRGDQVVTPEHAYDLWRHWGEPAIHWFSGSHMAPFRRDRLMSRIAAHLRALDLVA